MADAPSPSLPGESDAYRAARLELLEAERELRREVERVAALRRALPPGGAIATDYVFEERDRDTGKTVETCLSDLFTLPDKSLVIYSFMYAEGANPCPMCTSFLDSFNGVARHVRRQLNVAVSARGSIEQLTGWADQRGWDQLRMLSSAKSTYQADYLGESTEGHQFPMVNVFRQRDGAIEHFWSTEIFYAENEPGQHPRHIDMIFPLWNLFDMTPEGRPSDWFPQLAYQDELDPESTNQRLNA